MVWLKIRRHDIQCIQLYLSSLVVVWLKIRRHDILLDFQGAGQSCGLIKD